MVDSFIKYDTTLCFYPLDMCLKFDGMYNMNYAIFVGILIYEHFCARLNISQGLGVLRNFMCNPSRENWTFIKRVFRYMHGASNYYFSY